MEWLYIYWFYLLNFLNFNISSSSVVEKPEKSNYYIAAVLEHNRKGNWSLDSTSDIINMNMDYFERAAAIAKSKNADIIIFPEYGFIPLIPSRNLTKEYTELVPDPRKVKANPCQQKELFINQTVVYRTSCLARRHNMVVVTNILEIEYCTKAENPHCGYDNSFHYNTNIAFDRDGTIIGKYRKERLFFEKGLDIPRESQDPIFQTDFGNFSMYICFDAGYKPIVDDVHIRGVRNIIITTNWIDTMPLWISVQWFQSWALTNKVTHLIANSNTPGYSTVGSGIFTGHMGALKYTFNPDGKTKLIVSRVPMSKEQTFPFPNPESGIFVIKDNGSEPYDESKDGKDVPNVCFRDIIGLPKNINKEYRCRHEKMANYTFVKLTKTHDKIKACNNGICCSLEYSTKALNESYYFGVHSGIYNIYDIYHNCEENCFIARCDAHIGTTCTHFPLTANTTFQKLKLTGKFSTKFIYPSVLESGVRLAPMTQWTYGIAGEKNVQGYLKYNSVSNKGLLVAGFAGRCYDRDPPYDKNKAQLM